MYNSKPEAYCHALKYLNDIIDSYNVISPCRLPIKICINAIKTALLNHEQDYSKIANILLDLANTKLEIKEPESAEHKNQIIEIANKILKSDYVQSPLDMWQNPLGRRLESEFAVTLLKNPTLYTMNMVKQVSIAIIAVIEANENFVARFPDDLDKCITIPPDDKQKCRIIKRVLNNFRLNLLASEDVIALGAFNTKTMPSMAAVKEILRTNSDILLHKIMHIHYKFAQHAYRDLPEAPTKSGRGSPIHERVDASNVNFYETPLFTTCPRRGRSGKINSSEQNNTYRLGLMLHGHRSGLFLRPERWELFDGIKWIPDCLGHSAQLDKSHPDYPIVRDMIENDTPYIAGYSGMCSLLMPQMMTLCDNSPVEDQIIYLCAVLGYIVGGGFHSIHEVLGPCAEILKLIPGYFVSIPDKDKKALPPNYGLFFEMVTRIDPKFNTNLSISLTYFIEYLNHYFQPKPLPSRTPSPSGCALPTRTPIGLTLSSDLFKRSLIEETKEPVVTPRPYSPSR